MTRLSYTLRPRPPFRLDLTVWALRRRPNNAIDRWDGQTYRRTLVLNGSPLDISVTQSGAVDTPQLSVTASAKHADPNLRRKLTTTLEQLLGLKVDLTDFHAFAADDPQLAPLALRFRGLKPPCFPTPFETLINAIACQQVTLTLGIVLLNRLAQRFGPKARDGHALPGPKDLARRRPQTLRTLGFSHQKALALVTLAQSCTAGRVDLDSLADLTDDAAIASLRSLRGIGRWSAEYVLLRGLGRAHIFPGDDVGARKNLQRWLHLRRSLDYDGVRRALEPWAPYGGLAYLHLLLDALDRKGYLS